MQYTSALRNINGTAPAAIQAKPTVRHADDRHEQEADSVADRVLQMPQNAVAASQSHLQRKACGCDEEDEGLQRKPLVSFIQKKESAQGGTAGSDVSSAISATRGHGNPLRASTKSFMESRFGTDFSDIHIHTGDYAVQLSEQLNAQAFTVGNDVYFNAGKYSPETTDGKRLLAHELTHIVQQGRIPIAVQRDEKDKTFAPKPEVDFKALRPDLKLRLFHFLIEADTSKVHLDYETKTFMAGFSYQYGDALSLNLKYHDFSTKLGWVPGDNKFSLGVERGQFNAELTTTPFQQNLGLGLHYGAHLLPFQDQMTTTFNAGGNSLGNLAGGLPGGLNNPLAYYQQHKDDIENISKTADLVKNITEAGKSKIRFGTDFSLTYDPVNKVVVTAKVGLLF